MIRLFGLVVLVLAAAVWIEPTVQSDERLLILRLRRPEEVIQSARERSRSWGARAADAVRSSRTPDVGAAAPDRESERLTGEEQRRLDRLVEEVSRER